MKTEVCYFSFFFLWPVFPVQNSITKILINQQVLILPCDWFLRFFWEYSRPESAHTEIKAKCDQLPQWQEVSGSILYCCPSFWQQWLLSTLVKLTMKWQWLSRALHPASKERKIGDLEPESGFAASDTLSDLFLSLCMAPRKSQLSGHPEKPRPILVWLVPFLWGVGCTQCDPEGSFVFSQGWTFVSYFSVSDGSSVAYPVSQIKDIMLMVTACHL